MAVRQAASVRQASSARSTASIWRRSIHEAPATSSKKPPISAMGSVRHQGTSRSREASSSQPCAIDGPMALRYQSWSKARSPSTVDAMMSSDVSTRRTSYLRASHQGTRWRSRFTDE